ncbi:hypothetical protein H1C71_023653, partial [Ictidomys tridecemlineatus]
PVSLDRQVPTGAAGSGCLPSLPHRSLSAVSAEGSASSPARDVPLISQPHTCHLGPEPRSLIGGTNYSFAKCGLRAGCSTQFSVLALWESPGPALDQDPRGNRPLVANFACSPLVFVCEFPLPGAGCGAAGEWLGLL